MSVTVRNPTSSRQTGVLFVPGRATDPVVILGPGESTTYSDIDPAEVAEVTNGLVVEASSIGGAVEDVTVVGGTNGATILSGPTELRPESDTPELQVESDESTGVQYARNLSEKARTLGIQPGEEIAVELPGGGQRVVGTAPEETGEFSLRLDGMTTEFVVEEGTAREVDGADTDELTGDASGGDGGGDALPSLDSLAPNDGTDPTPSSDPLGSGGDDDPLRSVFGAPDSAADEGSLTGLFTGSSRSGAVLAVLAGIIALAAAAAGGADG